MKIMHIIPGFPTGGAEQVVINYLEFFQKRNDCSIIALSLSENQHRLYEQKIEKEGLNVVYRDQSNDKDKKSTRLNEIKFIRNAVKEFQPDVVHIHLSILWVASIALLGIKGIKIFYTLHNEPNTILKGRFRYIDWFFFKLLKIYPICLNENQKKSAESLLWGMKCGVLGNGVNIKAYSTMQSEDAKRIMGYSNTDFVIGHVGRFNKQKNHDFIIDVFNEYQKRNKNARLFLVGNGELLTTVKDKVNRLQISDKVKFAGVRNDIPSLMQGVDVFLFPSVYEGLGIVFIEAQAAGAACVISDRVPYEAVCSKKVVQLSLDETLEKWCDAIDGRVDYTNSDKTIDAFSLESICEQLLSIYLEK